MAFAAENGLHHVETLVHQGFQPDSLLGFLDFQLGNLAGNGVAAHAKQVGSLDTTPSRVLERHLDQGGFE